VTHRGPCPPLPCWDSVKCSAWEWFLHLDLVPWGRRRSRCPGKALAPGDRATRTPAPSRWRRPYFRDLLPSRGMPERAALAPTRRTQPRGDVQLCSCCQLCCCLPAGSRQPRPSSPRQAVLALPGAPAGLPASLRVPRCREGGGSRGAAPAAARFGSDFAARRNGAGRLLLAPASRSRSAPRPCPLQPEPKSGRATGRAGWQGRTHRLLLGPTLSLHQNRTVKCKIIQLQALVLHYRRFASAGETLLAFDQRQRSGSCLSPDVRKASDRAPCEARGDARAPVVCPESASKKNSPRNAGVRGFRLRQGLRVARAGRGNAPGCSGWRKPRR